MNTHSLPNRQPTLLLIEDNDLVRDSQMRLFVREGFLVLTASTGHDGIGLLRTPDSPIDVVLLDIGLPDVSGVTLCARLRQLFPNLPVVVYSGAIAPEELDQLRELGISHLFTKPISVTALLAVIRSALAESPLPASPNGK